MLRGLEKSSYTDNYGCIAIWLLESLTIFQYLK